MTLLNLGENAPRPTRGPGAEASPSRWQFASIVNSSDMQPRCVLCELLLSQLTAGETIRQFVRCNGPLLELLVYQLITHIALAWDIPQLANRHANLFEG